MYPDFENTNPDKKEATEKNFPGLCTNITQKWKNNYNLKSRPKKSGYVAWPENKLSTTREPVDIEISPGRLRDGGYVAYPKKKS